MKIVVKMNSKGTKALIAASFFITIIAIVTPVIACGTNRVFFMAIGDDLDIPGAKNIIIGNIKSGGGGEPPTARVFFYSKIYDNSGDKVYTIMGMLKDGYLINTSFYFFCPLFKVWFINVSQVIGMGKFRTSDTEFQVRFRDLATIAMPNTEGKFVSAPIVMLLSPKAEYCLINPKIDPPGSDTNPIDTYLEEGWVLAGAVQYVPEIGMALPIGPLSSLTISIGI